MTGPEGRSGWGRQLQSYNIWRYMSGKSIINHLDLRYDRHGEITNPILSSVFHIL